MVDDKKLDKLISNATEDWLRLEAEADAVIRIKAMLGEDAVPVGALILAVHELMEMKQKV